MARSFNILFIADVVGLPGAAALSAFIDDLKKEHEIHFCVVNGENAAAGKGLTPRIAYKFFDMGIDVITSGNHIWNRDKIFPMLDEHDRILRPLNYPAQCPGHGSCLVNLEEGPRVGVINLQGRSFMAAIQCPFTAVKSEVRHLKSQGAKVILVDFHAEATAEKLALAWHLDGTISALIGTHTHVQTADESIFPGGMAYITDAGMTGAFDSVIGMDKNVALKRFISQMPASYQAASDDPRLNGVVISVDPENGKALSIRRVQRRLDM